MEKSQIEIEQWEIENKENIIGWDIHYGSEVDKVWVPYEGYKMIFFKMKDKTRIEFKLSKINSK